MEIDFFTVPSATFHILFVFVVVAHDRRRVLHFNVTEHPTAEWTAQQILEAFPWDTAPRYLLRDRDAVYGRHFRRRVAEARRYRGAHCSPGTLAESLRRAPHRLHPA